MEILKNFVPKSLPKIFVDLVGEQTAQGRYKARFVWLPEIHAPYVVSFVLGSPPRNAPFYTT